MALAAGMADQKPTASALSLTSLSLSTVQLDR
ncbi:MAG: hypothetical protein ACI87E_002504 [Mariniblastus sp.]|jgi:hypothetical protein